MELCSFIERRTPGGEEEPKREEAAGEIPARRKMTVTIAVIVVIETGGMTVRTDLHPETLKKVNTADDKPPAQVFTNKHFRH